MNKMGFFVHYATALGVNGCADKIVVRSSIFIEQFILQTEYNPWPCSSA